MIVWRSSQHPKGCRPSVIFNLTGSTSELSLVQICNKEDCGASSYAVDDVGMEAVTGGTCPFQTAPIRLYVCTYHVVQRQHWSVVHAENRRPTFDTAVYSSSRQL